MDGISCRLIKGDCRERGNGGQWGVKEEVLQIQSCCRRSEQHVAVAKGLCINSPAILHGSPGGAVEALDTSWIWELELRGSSMQQGNAQAHLVHEPAVPWGATWASLGFPKQHEG